MPKPSSPGGDQGEKGDKSKQQQKAGKDLQQAGQKVANAGKQLGGGESDPLIPKGDQQSDDPVFADLDAETGPQSGSVASDGEQSMPDDPLAAEIEAAQKALAEAGLAIQHAGATIEGAEGEEALAEAEGALSTARVAVIVAGQDLEDLKAVLGDQDNDLASVIAETEGALNEANVAIVVATETILPGIPELNGEEGGSPRGKQGGRTGELDEELEKSLVIFDASILKARRVLTDTAPPPSENDPTGGVIVVGSSDEADEEVTGDVSIPAVVQSGASPTESDMPEDINIATVSMPQDIPDPQGDDIVAKQLREAAIAEVDTELKEKLWEEYRRYKAGI